MISLIEKVDLHALKSKKYISTLFDPWMYPNWDWFLITCNSFLLINIILIVILAFIKQ